MPTNRDRDWNKLHEAIRNECARLMRDPDKGHIKAVAHVRTTLGLTPHDATKYVLKLTQPPLTPDALFTEACRLRARAIELIKQGNDMLRQAEVLDKQAHPAGVVPKRR